MFGISLCLSACVIVVTSGPGRQTQLCLYCCSWTGSKCKQTEGHAASYLSCVTVGHHLFVCSVICPMRCGSAPGGGVSPVDQSQRRKEPQNKRTSKVRRCVPTQRSDDKKKQKRDKMSETGSEFHCTHRYRKNHLMVQNRCEKMYILGLFKLID